MMRDTAYHKNISFSRKHQNYKIKNIFSLLMVFFTNNSYFHFYIVFNSPNNNKQKMKHYKMELRSGCFNILISSVMLND